ncbi:MAG: hypothetical protein Q8P67_09235 [archaeon]|nr:hypothetical protein [archaeon]
MVPVNLALIWGSLVLYSERAALTEGPILNWEISPPALRNVRPKNVVTPAPTSARTPSTPLSRMSRTL